MCANCGCGEPEDRHGNQDNITWSDITKAAQASNQSPQQAVQNMQDMARQQA